MFLEGRNDELADQLRARMLEASADQRFEEAAQLRDAMRTVQAVRERQQQKMASAELGDRDVFGVKVGASGAVVQVFIVRGGRVIERVEFIWDAAESGESEADVVEAGDSAVLRRSGTAAGNPRAGGAWPSSNCSKTG